MVHVSGVRGELRARYQRAAVLGAWSMLPSSERPNTFTFRAVVVEEHAEWMRHPPFDLVLALGLTEWVWHSVTFVREGSEMVIELTERPAVTQRAPVTRGTR